MKKGVLRSRLKVTGSRVVWAVRVLNYEYQTNIFRSKPTLRLHDWGEKVWSDGHWPLMTLCDKIDPILKLPYNKPYKITLKVSRK